MKDNNKLKKNNKINSLCLMLQEVRISNKASNMKNLFYYSFSIFIIIHIIIYL